MAACGKRPAFVNGLATSAEAQERARAYGDACKELGIKNARFYQATWQIEDGVELARRLLQSEEELPDTIFCCNDDLAIGMQETLLQNGVRVPEDVRITGFDNREISHTVTPRVTTVDRDYFNTGKTVILTMNRLLVGEDVPGFIYSPVQYKLRESCGYDSSNELMDNGDLYSLDNSLKRFYEVLNGIQIKLFGANSISGVLDICEEYAHEVRCPNVYLTMSDSYLGNPRGSYLSGPGAMSHLMAHAGSVRLPPHDQRHVYCSFPSTDVLPKSITLEGLVYVVYPLYRNDAYIGTLVTEGVSPLVSHGFLAFCLTLFSAGIVNARNIELLHEANSQLDNLYVHDELTGLFNRFGLDRFGAIAYRHLLRDFGRVILIFVDMDDMKGINDRFGHEMGDQALRDTASIISRSVDGENAFSMRYGGDEFLLICRNDLIPRLTQELERFKQGHRRVYDISLSMGAVSIEASQGCTLDDAIRRADERMYEIKRHRKSGEA